MIGTYLESLDTIPLILALCFCSLLYCPLLTFSAFPFRFLYTFFNTKLVEDLVRRSDMNTRGHGMGKDISLEWRRLTRLIANSGRQALLKAFRDIVQKVGGDSGRRTFNGWGGGEVTQADFS